jgi:choline monooxygenase
MRGPFDIKDDIRLAETIPAMFYGSAAYWEKCVKSVFLTSWQWVCHQSEIGAEKPFGKPFTFLSKVIPEPLLLIVDEDDSFRVLSNVCTHRGNILVDVPGKLKSIICGYHGRQFDLHGCFRRMPKSEEMLKFPTERDNLPELKSAIWKGLYFGAINAEISFSDWIKPLEERLFWLPVEEFVTPETPSAIFKVHAHWALYCENYLEGFHIPFVHPELNNTLDFGAYETHVFPYSVLQIGIAKEGELCFDLPVKSPDYGKKVAAYYFWLFPNLMLNFYPWGLSINIVNPVSLANTQIDFRYFVWKEELRTRGAGSALDTVEMQDEAIVEQVQKGVQSILYKRGRFSPEMEQGVHRFHQLLDHFLHNKNNRDAD